MSRSSMASDAIEVACIATARSAGRGRHALLDSSRVIEARLSSTSRWQSCPNIGSRPTDHAGQPSESTGSDGATAQLVHQRQIKKTFTQTILTDPRGDPSPPQGGPTGSPPPTKPGCDRMRSTDAPHTKQHSNITQQRGHTTPL